MAFGVYTVKPKPAEEHARTETELSAVDADRIAKVSAARKTSSFQSRPPQASSFQRRPEEAERKADATHHGAPPPVFEQPHLTVPPLSQSCPRAPIISQRKVAKPSNGDDFVAAAV
jgi:hypothetical protein